MLHIIERVPSQNILK